MVLPERSSPASPASAGQPVPGTPSLPSVLHFISVRALPRNPGLRAGGEGTAGPAPLPAPPHKVPEQGRLRERATPPGGTGSHRRSRDQARALDTAELARPQRKPITQAETLRPAEGRRCVRLHQARGECQAEKGLGLKQSCVHPPPCPAPHEDRARPGPVRGSGTMGSGESLPGDPAGRPPLTLERLLSCPQSPLSPPDSWQCHRVPSTPCLLPIS